MSAGEPSSSKSAKDKGKWIALVSGLDLSSADVQPGEEDSSEIRLQMLVEYLKGESGGDEEQASSSECKALIVLGNSLDIPRRTADDAKNAVRTPFSYTHSSLSPAFILNSRHLDTYDVLIYTLPMTRNATINKLHGTLRRYHD